MYMKKTVLIVGGYGVVGSQIARILHDKYLDVELRLGGRTEKKELPFESDRLQGLVVDNTFDNPLQYAEEPLTLVINAVNDPTDNLLRAAQEKKLPLIDITRWTEHMEQSITNLANNELHAPIIFASGWMGGTAALISKLFSENLQDVIVNINALYSLQDKAGPNSTAYMDRLTTPFYATSQTGKKKVYPMTEPRNVQFPNSYMAKCYRLDTPDHVTLLQLDKVVEANFRIAFDGALMTRGLVALVRSGIWKLISGEKFTSLRQKLLYNPGKGSAHHLVITLQGRGTSGELVKQTIHITDPLGQTHLTALGAVVQASYLLEKEMLRAGVYFPEDVQLCKSSILDMYRDHGVTTITK
jgi:hypothetical protein